MAEPFGAVQSGHVNSLVFDGESADIGRLPSPAAHCRRCTIPPFDGHSSNMPAYGNPRMISCATTRSHPASSRCRCASRTPIRIRSPSGVLRGSLRIPRAGGAGIGSRCCAMPGSAHPIFHLAIWSRVAVWAGGWACLRSRCGWTAKAVFIHFVESAHDPVHPLRRKITYLVAAAARAMDGFSARWLRLMDPLPGMLGRYEEIGFRAVREKGQVLYCERRIEP